jgi:CHAT domain-containing protein
LEHVELLTLSACETGFGDSGNGSEADVLAMLAEQRGAAAVLATPWPVADESTPELMQSFYRLREGHILSKAEALQQAQLAMLRGAPNFNAPQGDQRGILQYAGQGANTPSFRIDPQKPLAHPYYWAAFVLSGDWRCRGSGRRPS